MYKVSFVIPVYNRINLLINTLEALNYQNGHGQNDYEVIVVDDGSDESILDSLTKTCRSYPYKYIFLERNERSSCARARNFGWKAAEGEVVSFIDGDIILKEDYISEVLRYFKTEDGLLVIGMRLLLKEKIELKDISNRNIIKKFNEYCNSPEYMENRHPVFSKYSYNMSVLEYPWFKAYGCNMSISKKWIEKVGGFDECYKSWGVEDIEFAYKLYERGIKIVLNSKLLTMHQYHGTSDLVDDLKLDGYMKNVNYFLEKHPKALNMSRQSAICGFRGLSDIEQVHHQSIPERVEAIDIKDRKDLCRIKERIIKLSEEKNIEIIINDYTQDTNIDLWIQTLGSRNSTPKYYPICKDLNITSNLGKMASGQYNLHL